MGYADVHYSDVLYEGDMIEVDENTVLIGTRKKEED
ncbi:hypothetical protein NEOCIP111885_01706 [Pseudoneobacillus rhizosphaerae]|uniref:Uncharacterized protein n=1 Tax=Pseudoneobacillus rhizosphaerae TaxID=2880968 RepID=A0A9C7G8P3_9BACI|nr:hypothetical protein NEOCIP111885_01706 [Pseudoneobacillus rhizosphaerae]